MDLASKKPGTCRYSVKTLQGSQCHLCEFAYVLEEHDLHIISEAELKDEIIYTPAVGVARGKGTMKIKSLIPSAEVFRDHQRRSTLSEVSCVQRGNQNLDYN